MKVKNISEDAEDFTLLLIDNKGVEVNILIPKHIFKWASEQKTEEFTEYGLNLVTKGHYT